MDAQELRSLQEAYMEVVEGFRDLPVEKMKKKEDSLRSKNTSSGERVRSNIENVRTNIGKSQKTQSFGKSEISKKNFCEASCRRIFETCPVVSSRYSRKTGP